jgi:hypothetical protein
MCPACIASAAWVVGSAVSTGGVTALVVKTFGKKSAAKTDSANSEPRSNDHGYTHDESGDGDNRSV